MQLRQKRVLEFWDRSEKLSVKNKEYAGYIKKIFNLLLNEDIGNDDITTNSVVKKNPEILGEIVAKDDGIVAGLEEFGLLNEDLRLAFNKNDGDRIRKGDVLAMIKGNASKILERERVNLNLLQRMSGIATLTYNLNKRLNDDMKIAATRKTLWGLLDKKAVSVGKGLTHRLSLNDGILIKENHLQLLDYDFEKAVDAVSDKSKYVEIEVEDRKQALSAAIAIQNLLKISKTKNLFAMMFDKIHPAGIISIIDDLKNEDMYGNMLFEASGNINEENIGDYAGCGADILSMGCITNSAKALNMSQEIRKR